MVVLLLKVWHEYVCLQEEIYSSSYAAAAYLESIKFPKDKKVRLACYCTQGQHKRLSWGTPTGSCVHVCETTVQPVLNSTAAAYAFRLRFITAVRLDALV